MQVKPFLLSRTLTKPFRSRTYTPAYLRRCSGAALSANAISLSWGRSSGNGCGLAAMDPLVSNEVGCGTVVSANPETSSATKYRILGETGTNSEIICSHSDVSIASDSVGFATQ